jgi:hypothetical protein
VEKSATSYDLYSDGEGHSDKLVFEWYPFRISFEFLGREVFFLFYLGERRSKWRKLKKDFKFSQLWLRGFLSLEYNVLKSVESQQTFWRNISPSLGSKNKPSKKPPSERWEAERSLFFGGEDRGDAFLQNVGLTSTVHTAWHYVPEIHDVHISRKQNISPHKS